MLAIAPTYIVRKYHQFTYASSQAITVQLKKDPKVAIVLGGGITPEGKPRPTLANRLDAAKNLYDQGVVSQIIVSGDNRVKSYNEPLAMYNYLIENGVAATSLTLDRGGNSTYETCERAVKVFNVSEAVLVSQPGHLDRAVYLCRSFGMKAVGYAASYEGTEEPYQMAREIFSNIKAVLNVNLIGERTNLEPQPHIQQ